MNAQPDPDTRHDATALRLDWPDAEWPGIARVTLQRAAQHNALHPALISALTDAFRAMARAPGVRAVILRAEGTSFCAGADLRHMRAAAEQDWTANHADAQALAALFHAIASCPVPVLARVQGGCHGGGVGLVACADIVVALDTATFRLSEVALGLIPATISPYVLRAVGERTARRWFVTAETVDARQAHAHGLVHEVAADEAALDATVRQLAEAIARNSPQAIRACKRLIDEVAGKPIDAPLRELTARRIADARASTEGREGLQAFLQRRPPNWLEADRLHRSALRDDGTDELND
ncbi:enoyl-CoA hydratase-related protein [uncultured Aquabacterium sp.]|uniref:enoyl-CoA hydratase-related protein n=1 Tax=uncultured Aquabacterium sp. TaxID=158753 RepID=UPI0025D7DD9B|nr:enoyl-CoA hydratase-related protein [uncultured Aquabacterium sp.]